MIRQIEGFTTPLSIRQNGASEKDRAMRKVCTLSGFKGELPAGLEQPEVTCPRCGAALATTDA